MLVVFIVGLLFAGGYGAIYYNTSEVVTITVTDKERITESSGEDVTSKYLVFTETETFENTDELIFGKWNSSDVQGKLKVDSTYTVKVVGWRLSFFSMYRNIVEVK